VGHLREILLLVLCELWGQCQEKDKKVKYRTHKIRISKEFAMVKMVVLPPQFFKIIMNKKKKALNQLNFTVSMLFVIIWESFLKMLCRLKKLSFVKAKDPYVFRHLIFQIQLHCVIAICSIGISIIEGARVCL
jgi:hypothetical protein